MTGERGRWRRCSTVAAEDLSILEMAVRWDDLIEQQQRGVEEAGASHDAEGGAGDASQVLGRAQKGVSDSQITEH